MIPYELNFTEMLMSKSKTWVSLCLKVFEKIYNVFNNPKEKSD